MKGRSLKLTVHQPALDEVSRLDGCYVLKTDLPPSAAVGLSQAQFATKFGFPPATLRNWEQGRARPDAPTRVLLAVIAKHPEAVEDVLRKAS